MLCTCMHRSENECVWMRRLNALASMVCVGAISHPKYLRNCVYRFGSCVPELWSYAYYRTKMWMCHHFDRCAYTCGGCTPSWPTNRKNAATIRAAPKTFHCSTNLAIACVHIVHALMIFDHHSGFIHELLHAASICGTRIPHGNRKGLLNYITPKNQ